MKAIRNTILTLIVGLMAVVIIAQHCYIKAPSKPPSAQTARQRLDILLDAIEAVESGGDANAVGDGGDAVGSFQIHKIYVDDVNRICRLRAPNELYITIYEYHHRTSPVLSRRMAKIYLNHYGKGKSLEDIARIHNGGPDGWKKESTKPYWEKVKRILKPEYYGVKK